MRVERRGGSPDLQTAFAKFIVQQIGGRALDDNQDVEAAKGKFPDFACFRDMVLIEMKHLETDQHARINEVLENKVAPAERPFFFGKRDGHLVIDKVSNGEEINRAIISKLARTIETLLRQADQQFTSYRRRNPTKNSVCICVILNSTLQEFSPDAVIFAVRGKMKPDPTGEAPFPSIDAVLYISEKHFTILPGRIAFAIAVIEAAGIFLHPWKEQFVNRIVEEWSRVRTGDRPIPKESARNFDSVNDIPNKMTRSEFWSLEYERRPYMKAFSVKQLKVLFRKCAVNPPSDVNGNWLITPQDYAMTYGRCFAHLIAETNRRGLDLRQLDFQAEQNETDDNISPELVNILRAHKIWPPARTAPASPNESGNRA